MKGKERKGKIIIEGAIDWMENKGKDVKDLSPLFVSVKVWKMGKWGKIAPLLQR